MHIYQNYFLDLSKIYFKLMRLFFIVCVFTFSATNFYGQTILNGVVLSKNIAVANANITILTTGFKTQTDSVGNFKIENIPAGNYKINISAVGYVTLRKNINILPANSELIIFELQKQDSQLDEIVVSGTLKAVKRLESPVPVEVYSPVFLKKNPTASIYEALQNVNGVRPQLNCGICNTGDIHINGLEGPYTLVLIDGMPIVSSLSTVYGLSGIPNSLVERIEIVKGPASSLYGSEAVGGLINIITKKPFNAPLFSVDFMSNSYLENNLDLGLKYKISNKITGLMGLNYFKFDNKVDADQDNFTDITLADRISLFNKWTFERPDNRLFSIALRGVYEDRWGGDMRWEKKHRGGNEIYGESIYTKRAELLGTYQLPTAEKLVFSFSGNVHFQDSQYGLTSYIANQKIAFGQLVWDKKIGRHDLLAGTALRYNYYDDNTPATTKALNNNPEKTFLPGLFIQNEMEINKKNQLLLGARVDYNSFHGTIFTPRLAYKLKLNDNNILRLNAGTGFRVVNLFTEDHAALTGSRTVVIKSGLNPEQSVNINLNYIKKIFFGNGNVVFWETSAFRTRFSNKIISDFETDSNIIFYDNIKGYAISQGIVSNIDLSFGNGLKIISGVSFLDNRNIENGISVIPVLTERFTGTFAVSYKIKPLNLLVDYTGNVYGKMRLPLLNDLDPRAPYSPLHSIQNIQFTYSGMKNIEFYGGVKNLLNFLPRRGNPFLIARSNDPFDQNVQFDANGQVLATADNPYALTFDTTYIFAQNQGIRGFFGIRYNLN